VGRGQALPRQVLPAVFGVKLAFGVVEGCPFPKRHWIRGGLSTRAGEEREAGGLVSPPH